MHLSVLAATIKRRLTMVTGQVNYKVAGTYNFTIPAGVYSVSVALVAAGTKATLSGSGDGGNLRYQNDYPVKPGEVIQIVVGDDVNNPLSRFGNLRSDSPLGGAIMGADGSRGTTGNSTQRGGNVGGSGFNRNVGAGINLETWAITTNTGIASAGNAPGAGGDMYVNDDGRRTAYRGNLGMVRIIWGTGRAFPDKNIGNL